MLSLPNDNPLLILTVRQAEALGHRLEKAGRAPLSYAKIGDRMGTSRANAERLVAKSLRRLDQSELPREMVEWLKNQAAA